jgi:O-antigen/teichoic acid export membrane protein
VWGPILNSDVESERGDVAHVRQRALRGVVSMAGRELAVKVLALGGWIVLARLLDPAAFGWFAVANFCINVFALLSELGLGADLIRRHGDIPRNELTAFFTFQLAVATALALLACIFALAAGTGDGRWVVCALALAFVIISVRTVPSVLAQRQLWYVPAVLADVMGQFSFWAVAIVGALAELGVWSVVWAVLASAMSGTAVIYARVRWWPGLNFDWRGLGPGVLFSVKFQSQTASSFAKYMMLPGVGGLAYGAAPVGYITWAHQLAALPVQLAQLVSRVSYPAFSQLRHNRYEFARLVGTTLKWTYRCSLPIFAVMWGLAPQIIEHIYGAKWLPALPSLYLLILMMAISAASGVLLPAIYSLGNANGGLFISLAWAALTWILGGIFALVWPGVEALALAYLIATIVATIMMLEALRDVGLGILLRGLLLPMASGVILAAILQVAAPVLVHSLLSLLVVGGVGGLVGLAVNTWGDRAAAIAAVRSLGSRKTRQASKNA